MTTQPRKYVIKAVGYNMWVSELEKDPLFPLPKVKMTLIYEKALVFNSIHDAEWVLSLMNSPKGDIEYIIKEVFV